jgi:hypothetical protein
MKLETMSKNIVNIMKELSKNEGLARLLVNETSNPFDSNLPAIDKSKLIVPSSEYARIFPYPFDPEAQVDDSAFIRVYYNNGDFDSSEIIAESQLNIDIIVAKSLWLINDGQRPLIRPYEIMGRVIDMVGKRSLNSTIRLEFEGYQHLAVNGKFDAIRLYSNYFSVET